MCKLWLLMSHIPATLSNMKPLPWVLTAHGLPPTEIHASLPPLLNVAHSWRSQTVARADSGSPLLHNSKLA
ncbi:hypothetical protein V8C34DRAFT_293940 [Trichoderma compactum]